MLLPALLFLGALTAGLWQWARVLGRWRRGEEAWPGFEPQPAYPRAPLALVVGAGAWLLVQIVGAVAIRGRDEPWVLPVLLCGVGAGTLLLVSGVLAWLEPLEPRELGLVSDDAGASLRRGWQGFLLAYPLVFALLMFTIPLRSRETQHSLITTVQDHPTVWIVVPTLLGAIVFAPLVEELLFRVLLQGTLRNRLQPMAAIAISSLLFAAVHGLPDAIPLIPLAMVLGWVYDRTNDYWAVVVLHATFNAFNLLSALLVDVERLEELQRMAGG